MLMILECVYIMRSIQTHSSEVCVLLSCVKASALNVCGCLIRLHQERISEVIISDIKVP